MKSILVKSTLVLAIFSLTAFVSGVNAATIHVDVHCDVLSQKPTADIQTLLLDGEYFTSYDAGYVPHSTLYNLGYVARAASDGTVTLDALDPGAGEKPLILGRIESALSCTWEDIAPAELVLNPDLALTVSSGTLSPCYSQVIDSEPVYYRSQPRAISLLDRATGRQITLQRVDTINVADPSTDCR